jgi:hypothetical protein
MGGGNWCLGPKKHGRDPEPVSSERVREEAPVHYSDLEHVEHAIVALKSYFRQNMQR